MSRFGLSVLAWLWIGCGAALSPVASVAMDEVPRSSATVATAADVGVGSRAGTLSSSSEETGEPDIDLRYQFGVRIPMRDGVELSAHIYRPADQQEPLPVLMTKTPYLADSAHEDAAYYAKRGYVVALVDARGRGHSGGVFRAFEDHGRDGHDVVEWLAKQPWCNGKVGMFGGSYNGFGQWTTLRELPPHLATIVPTASVGFGVDFPLWFNISYTYSLRWLTFVSGRSTNQGVFGDDAFWRALWERYWKGETSFRELDAVAGNPSDSFRTWVEHETLDDYYLQRLPAAEHYARIEIPILTITGHYDDDQPGALYYYREHMRHGSASGKRRHYLLIGPWDHGGTRRPRKEIGGLEFHDASLVDMKERHVQWFDWTLKGETRPEWLTDRVVYYLAEAGEWRAEPSLEATTSGYRELFLSSDGRADSVFHSGSLESAPRGGPDSYRLDPRDERLLQYDGWIVSQPRLVDRDDGVPPDGASLVYHSAPLETDLELAGRPRLTAYLSMDVPDTDLSVRLFEVRPDGSTVFLTHTAMRARYRTSRTEAELVEPGAVEAYEFDDFYWFARTLRKGSRLRLVIGGLLGSSWQHNFQSGKPIADETAADARVGTITLYHDDARPSTLELPIAVPDRPADAAAAGP